MAGNEPVVRPEPVQSGRQARQIRLVRLVRRSAVRRELPPLDLRTPSGRRTLPY